MTAAGTRGTYTERPARLDGAFLWARTAPAAAAPTRPVLPDGCMDLVWADGHLFVTGPDTRPWVPGERVERYAGLRFAPGDAPRVLGVPARALRDRRAGLDDLWGTAEARRLAERIGADPDPAAALERLVLRRADAAPPPDPVLREVVTRLDAGRPVAATADALGLGARRLHRLSLDAFGYGPKTLARILRLQRALALLRSGLPPAETALRARYADQAHLTRETRALAGTTPAAYARPFAPPAAPSGDGSAGRSAKRDTPAPSGSRTTA